MDIGETHTDIENERHVIIKKRNLCYWESKYLMQNRRLKNKLLYFVAPSVVVAIITELLLFLLIIYSDLLQMIVLIFFDDEYTIYNVLLLFFPIAILIGACYFLFSYSFAISKRDKAEYCVNQLKLTKEQRLISKTISEEIDPEHVIIGIEKENKINDQKNVFFDNLIDQSRYYLNQYYRQTQVQAEKSFMVSLFISVFGVLVICVGIGLLFADKTEPAYVTTAAGVLSEFIATVFFYFYNSTVKSMSKYHNKLVLSQNISIALRVAEDLPEDIRRTVSTELIKELVQNINKYIVTEET